MPEIDGKDYKWWESAVAYQIYPRSFYDTDGDGVGDINGIIDKLDYLAGGDDSLGVDAVWISPFYPSPMVDSGYDITDYRSVDKDMGSLADFDRLINEAHDRGIKVIVDFIPNHTSDQHPWFVESRSSKVNPKRDWYVWHGAKDGKEPNNWLSTFGGSAWQYDEATSQYYLHSFSKEQPDLNWANPDVRQEMINTVEYWFDKGVDGLRVDSVNWLSKDPGFNDDPPNPDFQPGSDPYHKLIHAYSCGGRELYNYLNELVALCAKRGDRFMITEAYPDLPLTARGQTSYYLQFYDNLDYRYCAPFNFELISSDWDASMYGQLIEDFQKALLPGLPQVYALGNHDKQRLASRLGRQAARTAATLQLSLPGMSFIYYGDEIGMTNAPEAANALGDPQAESLGFSRQIARTPMQWSASQNAGFSSGRPWLPVANNFNHLNVVSQSVEDKSFLNLYKQLIKLRKSSPALSIGDCRTLEMTSNVLAYSRNHNRDRKIVVLNFSENPALVESHRLAGRLLLSNYLDDKQPSRVDGRVELRPGEAIIIDASDHLS